MAKQDNRQEPDNLPEPHPRWTDQRMIMIEDGAPYTRYQERRDLLNKWMDDGCPQPIFYDVPGFEWKTPDLQLPQNTQPGDIIIIRRDGTVGVRKAG